ASVHEVPGKVTKRSSQLPTALGRDSSINGPRLAAVVTVGVTRIPASAIPARPTPNFFSAARRVTDWAMLFVSSSNLLFILLLSSLSWLSSFATGTIEKLYIAACSLLL